MRKILFILSLCCFCTSFVQASSDDAAVDDLDLEAGDAVGVLQPAALLEDDADIGHLGSGGVGLDDDVEAVIDLGGGGDNEIVVPIDISRAIKIEFIGRLVGLLEANGQAIHFDQDIDAWSDTKVNYEWNRLSQLARQYGYRADGTATEDADIPGERDNRYRCGEGFYHWGSAICSNLQHFANAGGFILGVVMGAASFDESTLRTLGVVVAVIAGVNEAFKLSADKANQMKDLRRAELRGVVREYNALYAGMATLDSLQVER